MRLVPSHWYISVSVLLSTFAFSNALSETEIRSLLQKRCRDIVIRLVPQNSNAYINHWGKEPGGGFCGPACLINAAQAWSDVEGKPLTESEVKKEIELLLTMEKGSMYSGTTQTDREALAKLYFGLKGYEVEVDKISNERFAPTDLTKLANSNKTGFFAIGAVSPYPIPFAGFTPSHAILITGHDPATKTISYIDPMYPKVEKKAQYRIQLEREMSGKQKEVVFLEAPELHWINKAVLSSTSKRKKDLFLLQVETYSLKKVPTASSPTRQESSSAVILRD